MMTATSPFESKILKTILLSTACCAVLFAQAPANAQSNQEADNSAPVEEIIVTGVRGSMLSAIAAKRNADSVIDVINAEDIGKFPDTNLAESLQRITGVQIARDGSEGTQISIRGLDPTFTRVTINGQAGGTSDPRTGFNFSTLGSEMASSLEVIKSVTAAHEEGGLGGTINVKTRRPLSFKEAKATVNVKGTYEDFSEEADPYVSFLAANQFNDGKFGVLLNGKYSERNYREDFIDIRGWHLLDVDGDGVENDLGLGRTRQRSRLRESTQYDLTATFQYRPNDDLELYSDFTYGEHDRLTLRDNLIEYDFSDAAGKASRYESYTLSPNGNGFNTIDSATFLASEKKGDLTIRDQIDNWVRTTFNSVIGAKWATGDWEVEGAVSYAHGTTTKSQQQTSIKLDDGKHGLSIGYNINPEFGSNIGAPVPMSTFVYDGAGNPMDVSDPNMWSARLLDDEANCADSGSKHVKCVFAGAGSRDIYVDNFSGNLDLIRSLDFGDVNEIQFGARYRERTREAEQYKNDDPEGFDATFADILDNPDSFGVGDGTLGDFPGITIPAYFNAPAMRDLINAAGGVEDRLTFRAADYLYSQEKAAAVYAMANLDGELRALPYRANFGVRAVYTDNTSQGVVWDDDEDEGPKESFAQTEDGVNYWDILPSANIVLMPTEKLLLRFSATKVMTRPELGDVTTSVKYVYDDRVDEDTPLSIEDSIIVKLGNGKLEPFRAWQYDVAVEYYTEAGGLLNVGLFYKDVESFITSADVDICADPTGGGWLPGGEPGIVDGQCYFGGDDQNGTIDYAQTINGEGAVIQGVEVGIQQVFTDLLPSPWDGLGVQANYTYVDSTSPIKDGITGVSLPLEGVSEDSYNFVVFYEKYDFSGRVAYNYRSEYLVTAFDPLSNSSVMRDERGQLDLSLSYDINQKFNVYLNGINLTNEIRMDYVADISRLRHWAESGRRYQLGFRWKLG